MQAWAAAATGNSRLTNSDGCRHQGARTGPLFAHAFRTVFPRRLVCRSDPDSLIANGNGDETMHPADIAP
jgi:hypothetical protein